MMRSVAVAVAPRAPTNLAAAVSGNGRNKRVELSWKDDSANETGFTIERASDPHFTTGLTSFTVGAGTTTYSDLIGNTKQPFYYRVTATNTVGDTWDYSDPNLNEGASFPTKTVVSEASNTAGANLPPPPPAAPSDVTASGIRVSTRSDRVTVSWTDNSNDESGFRIQYARNAAFTNGLVTRTVGANVTSFTTGNLPRGTNVWVRVQTYNSASASTYVNATPFPVLTP